MKIEELRETLRIKKVEVTCAECGSKKTVSEDDIGNTDCEGCDLNVGKRRRGFPCYRCKSTGVIKSKIGVATCPVCDEWLRAHGWEHPNKIVPCSICKTDDNPKPDSAFWKKGVDLMCQTHAVRLQEGWLANERPAEGPCDFGLCGTPGHKYQHTREDGSTSETYLCERHLMMTPAGSTRALPDYRAEYPPIGFRCVRCHTTKHVDHHRVSLGDGRSEKVTICRECASERAPDFEDVCKAANEA